MNIFLDTMVYLHCVPIKQIDFCRILGAGTATILVPRVTFKELEKHKTNHKSSRIRDRSRQTLSFLESQIESVKPIRDGVMIQFIPNMPKTDFESHGLNSEWNDDLLIASVLECKEQNPSVETVLVTHDTGARLTCRHLGIKTIELPTECRLLQELDESEKENRRLRQQVQKLQNALPKIMVGFEGFGDELIATICFSPSPPEGIDASQISEKLSRLQAEIPKYDSQLSSRLHMISEKELDQYNSARQQHFENYAEYLRDKVRMQNFANRTLSFTIAVFNSGAAPADDVDIHLHFPDGFTLCSEDNLPSYIAEPRPPRKPMTTIEKLQYAASSIPDLNRLKMSAIEQPIQSSSFEIRKTNSYEISNHFGRIKHGFSESLPELFLTFDSHDDAASFNCDYEVTVGNLPEPITGKLHFVKETGADPKVDA